MPRRLRRERPAYIQGRMWCAARQSDLNQRRACARPTAGTPTRRSPAGPAQPINATRPDYRRLPAHGEDSTQTLVATPVAGRTTLHLIPGRSNRDDQARSTLRRSRGSTCTPHTCTHSSSPGGSSKTVHAILSPSMDPRPAALRRLVQWARPAPRRPAAHAQAPRFARAARLGPFFERSGCAHRRLCAVAGRSGALRAPLGLGT
ncbi:MAG: hypothetical protein J3K34DRAFT_407877 [Monoraphidium minutum]|nr:MAG: hypothetical protein J3K34DRAFT_407877 [Monoraphidium minutum]